MGKSLTPLVTDLLYLESAGRMMPPIGRLDILHANAGAYVGGEVTEGDPDA